MPERSTTFDSDFEQVVPRICIDPNRVKAFQAAAVADPVDAQERRADRLPAPQHEAVALLAPYRVVAEIPQALAVPAPVPKIAVKAPAAFNLSIVADAKATSGAADACADGNVLRRVSACTTNGQVHRRYNPSS